MMYDQSFGMMGGYMGGAGLFFWVTSALVWTALILAIIALLRWLKKNP